MMRAVSSITLFASLMISSSAFACSCAMPFSPRAHINGTDVIFEGSVSARTKAPLNATTSFEVSNGLKGDIEDSVTITHPINGAACGYTFDEGFSGLVFASYVDGKLLTNMCRMLPVDQDIKAYREELGLPQE